MGCVCEKCGKPLELNELWWCKECAAEEEDADLKLFNDFNSGVY